MANQKQSSGPLSANLLFVKLGFVAMYLFDAGEALIAFDTGMKAKGTLAELEKLHVDTNRVKHVFLTHSEATS